MKIFYYHAKDGNFGDDLNAWLWRELWPAMPSEVADNHLLLGIGTILGLPLPQGDWNKHVVGSGVGYNALPLRDKSWNFLAVRGPLSAAVLGLPASTAVTDSALLLQALPAYNHPTQKRQGTVFMPHLTAAKMGNWEAVCHKAGITYLDPRWDSKLLLGKIANAEVILADAMHGAICADALRTPWVPLASSREISTFKWMDWTLSMGLPYRPNRIPASGVVEALRNLLFTLLCKPYFLNMPAKPLTEEALVAWYQEKFTKCHTFKSVYYRYGGKVFGRFVVPFCEVLRKPPFAALLAPLDKFFISRAAHCLKRLKATAPTYQSDEKLQKAKLQQLLNHVETLKGLK